MTKALLLPVWILIASCAAQAGTVVCESAQTGNFSATATWTRFDWTSGSSVAGTPVACDIAIIGAYAGMSAPHVITFDGAATTLGGMSQKAWSGCGINAGAPTYSNNSGTVHVVLACTPSPVLANGDSVLSYAVTGAGAAAINNRAFNVANLSGAAFDLSGSTFTAAITGGVTERPAALERQGARLGANYGQVVIGAGNTLTVAGDAMDDYEQGTVSSAVGAWLIANAGTHFTFSCGFACKAYQVNGAAINSAYIVRGTAGSHATFNGGATPGDHGSFKVNGTAGLGNNDITYVDFINFGGNNSTDYAVEWAANGNAGGGDCTFAFSYMNHVTFTTSGGFSEPNLDGQECQIWNDVAGLDTSKTTLAYSTGGGAVRTSGTRTWTAVQVTGDANIPSNLLATFNFFDSGQVGLASPQAGSGYNFFRETANTAITMSGCTRSFYLLWDVPAQTNPHAINYVPGTAGTVCMGPGAIGESTSNVANAPGIFDAGSASFGSGFTYHNDDNLILPNAFGDASFYPCIDRVMAAGDVETCNNNTVIVAASFGIIGDGVCGTCLNIPMTVSSNLAWAPSGTAIAPASCDAHGAGVADLIAPDYNVKVNITASVTNCGPFAGQAGGYIQHFVAVTPGVHDLTLAGTPPLANVPRAHFALAMQDLGYCSPSGATDTGPCLTALKANLIGILPSLFWRIRSYMAPTKPAIWVASSTGGITGSVQPVMFPLPGSMRTVPQ